MDALLELPIRYLTYDFPQCLLFVGICMSIFGSMTVHDNLNKEKKLNYFHAFILSVCVGYGGALFTPWMLGRPIPLLLNDTTILVNMLVFWLVNFTPAYYLFKSLPGLLITTSGAILFRCMGLQLFLNTAYDLVKDKDDMTIHGYPLHFIAPIVYCSLLANTGPFIVFGFQKWLAHYGGMPWPFQNGVMCGLFYHFFSHDQKGIIGQTLRSTVNLVPFLRFGIEDDDTYAFFCISLFMQVTGIIQLPRFLGPMWNPFTPFTDLLKKLLFMDQYYTVRGAPVNVPQDESAKKNGKKETKKNK